MMSLFNSLNTLQKSLVVAIMAIILYIVTTGVGFQVFSSRGMGKGGTSEVGTNLPGPAQALDEEANAPKTQACPLNGTMHTQQAKDFWDKRRPLAVMIENHIDARPQSGLSYADVIYEAVAEGGITRFMAVYLCNLKDVQVGPVRSARTYFIDWLSEYDAAYGHVGGANTPGPADALGQIEQYKIKDLNQFSIGFPTFWRDYQRLGHPVATEHTMYSTTAKLWDVAAKRGWTATDSAGLRWDANFVPWKFADGAASKSPNPVKVEVNFWESQSDYKVEWDYDTTCNCYKRKNAGTVHIDLDNNQQLEPTNVVVQFMAESPANDGYENNAHRLYADKGQGKALIFQNGSVTSGKWTKATRLSREKFLDDKGQEVVFARGQIWIETVPEGSKVTY